MITWEPSTPGKQIAHAELPAPTQLPLVAAPARGFRPSTDGLSKLMWLIVSPGSRQATVCMSFLFYTEKLVIQALLDRRSQLRHRLEASFSSSPWDGPLGRRRTPSSPGQLPKCSGGDESIGPYLPF